MGIVTTRLSRYSRFRLKQRFGLMALALAFFLIAPMFVTADPSRHNDKPVLISAVTQVVGAQSASASVPAPPWLINYFNKNMPLSSAQYYLKLMGYTCAWRLACWLETNYDPPRWFYYGVVQTGNGPSGYLRARGWPSASASVPRTFPENWKLVIFCQTHGDWVYGRWGWTNVWDYVGHYGDSPMFVSDGFVYTGTNGFVSGDCAATNYGGNP